RLIFLPSLALPMIGIGTMVIVLPVILWGIMVPLTYQPVTGLPQPGLTFGLALAPLVALAGLRALVWTRGLGGAGRWRRLGRWAGSGSRSAACWSSARLGSCLPRPCWFRPTR